MEVAGTGQWRREWAGTAEYGKVKLMEYLYQTNYFLNLTEMHRRNFVYKYKHSC